MKCRLCGKDGVKFKFKINVFDPPFEIFECSACGFQQRSISSADAYAFYDEGYYKGKNNFSYMDERRQEKASRVVWHARMKRLRKWDRSQAKDPAFLDVGCSFGGLMATAQEEFAYKSYGVEVSDYSGAYARERFGKDRVFVGNVETLDLPKDRFSIVTMIEVIEHLFDPMRALANLFESMKSGGVILIQTADMDGLQAKREGAHYHYYLPGHLSYFNRHNLKTVMQAQGWKEVRFIGGVEFGLLPKLIKSRASFQSFKDYLRWFAIARYHFLSKIVLGPLHLTSSMVMVGRKP